VQFLHVSSADQVSALLEELGSRHSATTRTPEVSTGSLTLDLHTGYQGLPRRGIVAMGGDMDGAKRLAASMVEATTASGGAVVVVGRFDDPPSWTISADAVLDWRGNNKTLRELVGDLGNVADILFVSTPGVLRLTDVLTSSATWLADMQTCMVAMPESAGLTERLAGQIFRRLRRRYSRTGLVLEASRFEALPVPHLDVRVLKPGVPDPVVSIDYASRGVDEMTDLVGAGIKIGVVRGGRHEPISYGAVNLGKEIRSAGSFLRGRPDLAASLRSQIHSELDFDHDSVVRDAIVGEHTDEANSGAARYVNTWFEADEPVLPLVVGRPVRFCLDIGPRSTEAAAQPHPFAEPDFGRRDSLWLLVTVYGEGFDVAVSNHVLELPRVGRAGPVVTEVTPRRPDDCSIRILISLQHELTLLQDLTVRPPVVSTKRAVV
jgi:hypothetical protein